MTERVVKVSLLMEASQYLAENDKIARKTRDTGSEVEKLGQKKEAFETLGRSALVMGTVVAVGIGAAVAKYAEFDAQMSAVQAATHSSVEEQHALRDAAIEAGASTVFSATESAQAIEEMSKAGVSATDILGGGLAGSLSLAAAGSLEVGRAAEIGATALTQFKLRGSDIPHVADLLAAGAGKAQGSVEDLSQALNQGGLVASQTGLSIEETTGTLAAFASAGLIGSDAGTSFKTMLQRLTPQSAEAREEMKRLGIQAYDTGTGKFVGMAKFAGVLRDGLKDLTDEQRNASLGIIFGSDAVRAASVIYDQGAEGVQGWIDKVDDSGYAAETARLKLNNLNGDLERLGGSFDTALIKGGSGANDTLRALVQSATVLTDAIGGLPAPVTNAGLVVAVLAAGVAGVGGAALLAVPKLATFKTSLDTLKVSGGTAARAISGIGLAAAGITVAIGNIVEHEAAISSATADFADSLDKSTGAITSYTRSLTAKKLAESGIAGVAKEVGVSQKELTNAIVEGGDEYDRVMGKFSDANTIGTAFTGLAFRAGNASKGISELREGLVRSEEGFDAAASAAEGFTGDADDAEGAADRNSAALTTLAGKAQSAGVDVDALAESIRGFSSGELDAREAARQFEDAVDAMSKSIEDNGAILDIGTEAGRNNEAALDAIAQKAKEVAAATIERGGSEDEARAAVQRGRDELILALGQFGINGQAAEDYATKLGLVPDQISTAVDLNTSDAQKNLDTWLAVQSQRTLSIMVRATMPDLNGAVSGTGRMGSYASGGDLDSAPGPIGVDSKLFWGARGEHVLTASDVSAMGGQMGVYAFRQALHAGIGRYAGGGAIRGDRVQYVAGSGTGGTSSSQSPRLSLEGARVTLVVGGREFDAYVQEQAGGVVASATRSQETASAMGWSVNR